MGLGSFTTCWDSNDLSKAGRGEKTPIIGAVKGTQELGDSRWLMVEKETSYRMEGIAFGMARACAQGNLHKYCIFIFSHNRNPNYLSQPIARARIAVPLTFLLGAVLSFLLGTYGGKLSRENAYWTGLKYAVLAARAAPPNSLN